ncbi:hypothetical protein P7C73_g5864, partial [Tremellales sp. Uapishka_1]
MLSSYIATKHPSLPQHTTVPQASPVDRPSRLRCCRMKRQMTIFLTSAVSSLITPALLPHGVTRLLPLLGSLISFQWCYDEYYLLAPLVSQNNDDANEAVGKYYSAWQESLGPAPAALSFPLTLSSSLVTLYGLYTRGAPASTIGLYAAGLTLSIIHIPFGGKAFGLLETVKKGNKTLTSTELSSVDAMKSWLHMHGRRLWMIDAPALVVFLWATIQSTAEA